MTIEKLIRELRLKRNIGVRELAKILNDLGAELEIQIIDRKSPRVAGSVKPLVDAGYWNKIED